MTWQRSLREAVRSGLAVERTRLEPLAALRGAAGVAVVVALALWLTTPAFAASSAFGAFAAGMATFQRSWRPRPVLALAAGGGLAFSTFLGYLAAGHTAAFVALLAVWSLGAGTAWALGPTSGVVASLTVTVMLVVVTLPTSLPGALGHAGVIAFGGLVQAALIVVFPIRRWGAQRDALAEAFAAVADYARRLRHDPMAPFDPEPMMTARSAATLSPRQARRRPAQLRGVRAVAERIRPVLASLADPALGAAADGPERERARQLLAVAAEVLDAVAHSIRTGRPVRLPGQVAATLEEPEGGSPLRGPARRAAGRLAALLEEAVEEANGPSAADQAAVQGALLRPTVPKLLPLALRAVRRELRWDSPVLRHAVRLSVVTPLGYVLGWALPLGHGYWAPVTSTVVLRPDFSQTYARGVARFAGTLAGLLVAGAVMRFAAPGPLVCAGLAVVCLGLMYLLLRTGYAVASACLTAYVVFLLGMAGVGWHEAVTDRVLLTLLGGALAMAAYAVFPTWETTRLRERLADWLEATGRYAAEVVACYAHPADRRRHRRVREALLEFRSARLAWDQAVGRARVEPVRHRGLSPRASELAKDALTLMARGGMLLEAHLPSRDAPPIPEADAFAQAVRAATASGSAAIRQRSPFQPSLSTLRQRTADPALARATELIAEALEDLANAVRPSATAVREERGSGAARGKRRPTPEA
ncbi:FUSC family protein [Streptomyces silvisoli]|uniref:FUSC family protein n=1 Tax=Streptomyces silvisoli TaxID=3034235 RepID=A0ABT5ZPP3_9ACTN|nr:FUSC family protein [Streptomyces silvisoli]MDF3291796.1 FUSC family protein [Streptomyces silvisoli]